MDVDKKNTEALLMRAYIYMLRRDYKGARLDYQRLLEIDPKNYNGRLFQINGSTIQQNRYGKRSNVECISIRLDSIIITEKTVWYKLKTS